MMKPVTQRLWAAVLAGALAVGGLSACNMGPTTTESLLAAYEKAQNRDNYHAVSTVTLGSDDGDSIKIESTTDVAGDSSKSTMTADMFGISTTSEGYVEKAEAAAETTDATTTETTADQTTDEATTETTGEDYVSYSSVSLAGATLWTKSKTSAVSNVGALTDSSVLAEAEFAKADEGYTLTVPAEKVYSALTGTDVTYEGLKELAGEGLADALATSKATYTFDKNCLLTSISCPVTFQETDQDGNVTSSVSLSFDFTVSDYGTIAAESLAVPDDVKNSAVDLDELQANISEFGDSVAEALGDFASGLGDLANTFLEDSEVAVDVTTGDEAAAESGTEAGTESGTEAGTETGTEAGTETGEPSTTEAGAEITEAAA